MKRLVSLILTISMITSLIIVVPAQAATQYNATKALEYAQNHWNDGKGLCAEFVSDCLTAGGISVNIKATRTLRNWLVKNNYATDYFITNKQSTRINMSDYSDKISKGDIIINYCLQCDVYPHVMLVSGTNSKGQITYYAHNSAANNKAYWNGSDGYKSHPNHTFEMHILHMHNANSAPVHTHTYSKVTESNHPHKSYSKCSCGTTEYLGSAMISSCSSCYPVGNVSLTRSFEKTKGNATFYRNNVNNATSYTLKVYKNNSLYNTYNMSSSPYAISGLPSGNYYATLYARNANTGEERKYSCDSFNIADSYLVSFNANGGTNAPSSQTKIEDTSLTLTSSVPKREGHIFKGWASSKNALTPQYQSGDSYTKNARITLYAVWEPETYTVKFDTNGGVGTVESQTITYGNAIKMPNNIVKDYSYLIGWATDKNATIPDYNLGTDYKIKSNLTLYAVWGNASWSNEVSDSLEGKGTETEPYLISTAADLAYLANKVNTQTTAPTYEYYKLTNNINLNYWEWLPIGVHANGYQYFYGSFDGNGYTISDMYITKPNQSYIGLFGYVHDSKIKNFTLTGAIENITAYGCAHIGGVAGYNYRSTLENIKVKYFNIGSISSNVGSTSPGTSITSFIGMIAGRCEYGKILNCVSYDNAINLKAGRFCAGLIAGSSILQSIISDCLVTSTEEGLFSTSANVDLLFIGGICGSLRGTVKNCSVKAPYFSNNIKSTDQANIGGLIGAAHDSEINVCSVQFTDPNLNSFTISGNDVNIGGIVGSNDETLKISDCKFDGNTISGISTSKHASVGGLLGDHSYDEHGGNVNINRTFININGFIKSNAKRTSDAGGIIGFHYYTDPLTAKNIMVLADGIISTSGSSYKGYAGYIIGRPKSNTMTIENAYYNTEMSLTSSTNDINTDGIAKSKKSMNVAFYTNIMGLTPYSSLNNLKENDQAVWVLKNSELPELYYNCLNDITVSDDIENGSVTIDKKQAIDGEIVTVTATPNENYVLNKIYVNGTEIDGTSFEVSGDSEVYATFSEKIAQYSVNVSTADNASASLANADEAVPMLLTLENENTAVTELTANDGEEILVNAIANNNYTVDTIYVNGEEIAGESFIIEKDSIITMDVASTSTEISAKTNDATDVGSYYAVVSGSVADNNGDVSRYIRYWSADDTETVYTTERQAGAGELTAKLINLEANTTYYYQMTEFGDVKSFTTCAEEINEIEEDTEDSDNSVKPITTTTYKKLTSKYKFNIEVSQELTTEFLAVAAYSNDGKLISLSQVACDGDTSYTASVPIDANIDYAKIFVWKRINTMVPIAGVETIKIGACEVFSVN